MTRPLVVHISADFPDAVQPRKTRAIIELVDGTSDAFEHRVYSLNRVPLTARGRMSRPGAVEFAADDGRVASLTYAAPARGLFLATAMQRVAVTILEDLERNHLRPVIVQGHKLSIEGLAAHSIARLLSVPYALSLQGNTDQKVMKVRRDLWGAYSEIFRGASAIFPFAPWIARWCEERLGFPSTRPVLLPCVLANDTVLAPVMAPQRIVTAFHLDHWRLKNARTLVAACARISGASLQIAGEGSQAARDRIDRLIVHAGLRGRASRLGHVSSEAMQPLMNGAAVFSMPSVHETFGMVFVEALLAGCPIVFPEGRAVDGYFEGFGFALAVPPRDVGAVAEAMRTLLNNQGRYKAELLRWQQTSAATAFRRDAILSTYRTALKSLIGTSGRLQTSS